MSAASSTPRVAVVTGATSGIGLELARRLHQRGHRLVLVGRDLRRLEAAGAGLGADDAVLEPVDVADPDAVAAFTARTLERFPRIDLLVCNAGVPARQDALQTDPAVLRRVMGVNVHGMADVTLGLWTGLVAARGTVVNVVSVAGTVATAYDAPYTASKHAALAWSRSLAAVASRDGVRVLTVNPGPVVTPGFPQAELLRSRLARRVVIDADRCADDILRALHSGRREVFVPGYWRVAAWVQAVAPGLARRLTARARRGPAG